MSVCLGKRIRKSGSTLWKTTLPSLHVHPGLMVLREGGLTRGEQWDRVRPVLDLILKSSDDNFLINKVVEISGQDEWEIREIPKPQSPTGT